MKIFGDSGIFPVELDKNAKTLIWSCAVPLLLTVNCILIQICLAYESRQQCRNRNEGGFSFDVSHYSYSMFDLTDLPFIGDLPPCSNDYYSKLIYVVCGILIYVFAGLSIIVPGIVYSRYRPVIRTKLFG